MSNIVLVVLKSNAGGPKMKETANAVRKLKPVSVKITMVLTVFRNQSKPCERDASTCGFVDACW